MNYLCILLAALFAWVVITATGHAEYQIRPAPAAVGSARP